jgi:hypothetical protein
MAQKECFGILKSVFPLGESGLREVPSLCQGCLERVLCLKAAMMTQEGLEMREKFLERSERAGMIGRVERWSRKKELNRLMNEEKRKGT